MSNIVPLVPYAAVLGVIMLGYALSRRRREAESRTVRDLAVEAGLTEPASLHPLIDEARCLGCGACVPACPEGTVLGLINGKAVLIEPTQCIGHGACKAACPFDAISLVIGTETRGVDLPVVGPDFQTDVDGLYVAGELGGMGLIRNAVEQGRQAIEAISRRAGHASPPALDVVIVGSGPAGIAASLAATQHKLKFVTLEQDSLGGTVAHYPRGKLVMTAPVVLPIVGKVRFRETSKEVLLAFWSSVLRRTSVNVSFGERVETIERHDGAFEVTSTRRRYRAGAVLLAIGRRGTPRKLDVPGEDLPKVVYRLIDPQQYRGQHVLVVGGGDSALEAAIGLAQQSGCDVTISYRRDAFSRANPKNRKLLEEQQAAGRVRIILNSTVKRIHAGQVELEHAGGVTRYRNDAVIVCAGGLLPMPWM